MHWVRVYSGLDIAFHSDRPIVIAGLANRMGEELQDTYHAGLWKESLAEGLHKVSSKHQNWSRARELLSLKTVVHGPSPFIAPSWSWISANTAISDFYDDHVWMKLTSRREHDWKKTFSVLQVQTTSAGSDAYGRVLPDSKLLRSGNIRRLLPSFFHDMDSGYLTQAVNIWHHAGFTFLDQSLTEPRNSAILDTRAGVVDPSEPVY